MGVILLDSINLDESLGKVTVRDRDAVNDLVVHTFWSSALPATYLTFDENSGITVDTNSLFEELQLAKYNPLFWNNFPVNRALGSDFKYFQLVENAAFGISTVLMPAIGFIEKEGFAESTSTFMSTVQVSFLAIMFAFYDETKTFHRQLAFVTTDQHVNLQILVESLMKSSAYMEVDLQLEEVAIPSEDNVKFQFLLFDQNNVSPSRKQIGPMITFFINSECSNIQW